MQHWFSRFWRQLGLCLVVLWGAVHLIGAVRQPEVSLSSSLPGGSIPAASLSPAPPDRLPLIYSEVCAFLSTLPSSRFIERLQTDADRIEIRYYADYQNYALAHPHLPDAEPEYNRLFKSRDSLISLLMQQSASLFRQFPVTATIEIYAHGPGQALYLLSITQGSLKSFDSSSPNVQDIEPAWATPEGRNAFAERFILISDKS
ncbi:hypothetical protein [Paenibacillus glufosinatiresistens]|uniref:hypothetical protein n=1 Tax=Paenibacillus glufosinatiresistens TaxID=3070657 RepID=UPI00286EB28A|nr:hypothetical protein [Paenibacillus sp. YX.27]